MSSGLFVAAGVLLAMALVSGLLCHLFRSGTDVGAIEGGCFFYVVALAMMFGGGLLGLIGLIAKLTGY